MTSTGSWDYLTPPTSALLSMVTLAVRNFPGRSQRSSPFEAKPSGFLGAHRPCYYKGDYLLNILIIDYSSCLVLLFSIIIVVVIISC